MNHRLNGFARLARTVVADARPGPRRFELLRATAAYALAYESMPKAEAVWVLDAFPEVEGLEVDVGRVRYHRSNMSPYERFCLQAIVMVHAPQRIFEIGTYDGSTTRRLALAAPNARVFTLDLPIDLAQSATVADERDHVAAGRIGDEFRGRPEEARITQLHGDSTTFDFTPYRGSIDLVLVDACHEYEYVRSDSRTALELVRPGGLVIWHDYMSGWPGVVRAVDDLLRHGVPVRQLAATSLAMARV
jgi:predicted O-methyltransferase YrrM